MANSPPAIEYYSGRASEINQYRFSNLNNDESFQNNIFNITHTYIDDQIQKKKLRMNNTNTDIS